MMTLALLVTAATSAWAADVLNLVVNGTSATIMYDGNASNNPILGERGWEQNGDDWDMEYSTRATITTVTIDGSCKNFSGSSLSALFASFSGLTTINGLDNLNTANVQNMEYMFSGCSSLTSLDLSSLNTASVTTMSFMFAGCSKLTSLDLSSWNTEKVTTTCSLFYDCSELTTVDLSSWNTAKVWNTSLMFYNCSKLENIYVGDGWSTAKVTQATNMFSGCTKLPGYDANKIDHAMAKLVPEGYLQKKPEGIELTWDAATRTATLDEMPEGNVVVDVEYYSRAGVTLADGQYPAGCTAALMDTTFGAWTTKNKLMEGQRFVLMIERPGGWDYTTSFDKGGASKDFMKEFTKDEYKAYIAYAKAQGLTVPDNAVLKWVTMPDTDDEDLTLGVSFVKQQTYTVMLVDEGYNMTFEKFCRFAVMQGEEETYGYAQMGFSYTGNNYQVMTLKITSAYAPTKLGIFSEESAAADPNATLENVPPLNTWDSDSYPKLMIVGGDATTVYAAYVEDPNTVPLYKNDEANFELGEYFGYRYEIVVCPVDGQGNVQAKEITLPEMGNPTGKQFAGWSVLDGTAPNKELKTYAAGATYQIKENTTFTALYKPLEVKTTFALNGGEGVSSPVTKDYGQTLGNIGEATRKGYVLDYWTVAKTVNESGILFGRGSQFDMNTALTANLELTAQWKHVHEYTCYTISRFGDALKNYQKYNGVLHIAVCGCNDVEIVEHEFNPAGKCVCGYEKPGATKVQLDIAYGKLEGTTFTNFANGFPEFPMKGQEVKVEAFHNWGDLEFKTWQYSTDGGQTWYDLAAYEIVGFLIPCNMKARACYVNTVTEPTIELSSCAYDDKTEYQGQTYTMGNILYQMNYKLPDGYELMDAGIRMGDNSGISYYEQKERTYSYDAEAKAIAIGICAGLSILNGEPTTTDLSATEKYWADRENCVFDDVKPAKLAKMMYESTPVNVPKYDPIYWEAQAKTKGLSGSIATTPPLRFAQKNNQNHYIYGIAYMRYKTPAGEMKVLYTDALAPTVNNPDCYTMKQEQPSGARLMHFADDLVGATTAAATTAASRKAPKREPEEQQPEQLDLSTITAPQTQLVVYADGKYNAQLSDAYGYGETATVTAPDVQGKTFSYWTADGSVISTGKTLTFTMNANTTLRAIYDATDAPAQTAAAILSATRSADGQKIVLTGKANGTFENAGFVYSTTNSEPTRSDDGIVAVKYSSLPTNGGDQDFYSVLDKNNCFTFELPVEDESTVYYVRAFTKNGSTTNYSDVREIKLASLKSRMMMVANLEAFENNLDTSIDDLLTQLQAAGQLPAGYAIEVAAGEYATFYCDKAVTLSAETAANAQLYTITAVSNDKATATAMTVAAANTPLLVKNTTETTQTVLLMPTDNAADNVTAASEFVGTLEDTQIAASTDDLTNYAFNGKQFVYVLNDLSVSANKAWLAIPTSTARQISIVFDDATAISAVSGSPADNSSLYTLDGRKVTKTRKGVYIMNGRKVVVR